MENTHGQNSERAYIAASRRSSRALEDRILSAEKASAIHKHRTGRSLRITEHIVANDEMYEEEDDDKDSIRRRQTAILRNARQAESRWRLLNYLSSRQNMGDISAFSHPHTRHETKNNDTWSPTPVSDSMVSENAHPAFVDCTNALYSPSSYSLPSSQPYLPPSQAPPADTSPIRGIKVTAGSNPRANISMPMSPKNKGSAYNLVQSGFKEDTAASKSVEVPQTLTGHESTASTNQQPSTAVFRLESIASEPAGIQTHFVDPQLLSENRSVSELDASQLSSPLKGDTSETFRKRKRGVEFSWQSDNFSDLTELEDDSSYNDFKKPRLEHNLTVFHPAPQSSSNTSRTLMSLINNGLESYDCSALLEFSTNGLDRSSTSQTANDLGYASQHTSNECLTCSPSAPFVEYLQPWGADSPTTNDLSPVRGLDQSGSDDRHQKGEKEGSKTSDTLMQGLDRESLQDLGTGTPIKSSLANDSSAALHTKTPQFHTVLKTQTAITTPQDKYKMPVAYIDKSQVYTISIQDTVRKGAWVLPASYRTFVRLFFHEKRERRQPVRYWQMWNDGDGAKISEDHRYALEFVNPSEACAQLYPATMTLQDQRLDGFIVEWVPKYDHAPECLIKLRFRFLSTAFSSAKGVRGVPLRLCVKTSIISPSSDVPLEICTDKAKKTEKCYCQVQVFREHGASRKHDNDKSYVRKCIRKLELDLDKSKAIESAAKKQMHDDSPLSISANDILRKSPPLRIIRNRSKPKLLNDVQQQIQSLKSRLASQQDDTVLCSMETWDDPDDQLIARPTQPLQRSPEATLNIQTALPNENAQTRIDGAEDREPCELTKKFPSNSVTDNFILRSTQEAASNSDPCRGIYLQNRTLTAFVEAVATKCLLDPTKVRHTFYVNQASEWISSDDRVIAALPENQNMDIRFDPVYVPRSPLSDLDVDNDSADGYILTFRFREELGWLGGGIKDGSSP